MMRKNMSTKEGKEFHGNIKKLKSFGRKLLKGEKKLQPRKGLKKLGRELQFGSVEFFKKARKEIK